MARDLKAYKAHLRDFLVEVLVSRHGSRSRSRSRLAVGRQCAHHHRISALFSFYCVQEFKADNDLYSEERAAQAAADLERRRAVPGLLNPYQLTGTADDDDL